MNDFDIDSLEGDYRECYQLWYHRYKQDPFKIIEAFKNSLIPPYIVYGELQPCWNIFGGLTVIDQNDGDRSDELLD
jgi:hypothetical protein